MVAGWGVGILIACWTWRHLVVALRAGAGLVGALWGGGRIGGKLVCVVHGWCPWSLWVDLRGRGVWVARCLGVGGAPIGLWGWGRLIIKGILIFFLSP